MPEVDRFERTLPPRWRKPYRVAKSGGAPPEVVDCIMPAFQKALAEHASADGFIDICELLHNAVMNQTGNQASLFTWAEEFARLDSACDNLALARENELVMRLAVRVAMRAYADLTADGKPVTFDQLRDTYAALFGAEFVENQLLARVRDGLRHARKRDWDSQARWESEVGELLVSQMKSFFRTLFANRRLPRRAPTRLSVLMELTPEQLSAPIDLDGSHE